MATNEMNIEERLKRLEAAMEDLKNESPSMKKGETEAVNKKVKDASIEFLKKPDLESAKVFLNELETTSRIAPVTRTRAWTTITVTIVTIMSDDQAGVISDRIRP